MPTSDIGQVQDPIALLMMKTAPYPLGNDHDTLSSPSADLIQNTLIDTMNFPVKPTVFEDRNDNLNRLVYERATCFF
jgi:hypothetical protein